MISNEFDLRRFVDSLTPQQRTSVNIEAAWQRYVDEGGANDDAQFRSWLALAYPEVFAVQNTQGQNTVTNVNALADVPVEVSTVLPARFAVYNAANTIADFDAPTEIIGQTRLLGNRFDVEGVVTSDARTIASDPQALPTKAAPAPAAVAARHDFHYILMGTAGVGGMGTVHIAKDTELLRRVALKQLSPEADAHSSARVRFLREVQITAQLDHPNIVPVYALELAPDGSPAYTMKFVQGKTFLDLLNEAREFFERDKLPDETRTLPARIEHFLKVCDAISYAHDKGIIHRDLKPANLMLGRHNEVYVMDWGLCRSLRQADDTPSDKSIVMSTADISGSASDTQIGDVVGTPKYMSPEQAQGRNRDLDARSDQCALGLILFEMVTLSAPYAGKGAYEVLVNAAVGRRRPVLHAYLGRRIPRELIAIIERSTKLSPDERYASVADMAADVRRYLRGDAVQTRPDTAWQRLQRAVARHRQRVLTGILALIALAAVAIGGLLWQNQQLFESERLREQRLLQLRDAVSNAGDRVQTSMLQLEGAIQNMADSVSQINQFGMPSEQRFYLLSDFRDADKAPPDLLPSKTYGGRISLGWPVWTLPLGMSEKDALPTIRKLASLQQFRRDLYRRVQAMIKINGSDMYTVNLDDLANTTGLAGEERNPLEAIMFAFDNGVASRYPGWDGLPQDYDPRMQPWYRLAVGKTGPQWGDTYLSSISGMDELPLSIPLYDADRHFVGVVSALLIPDLMVHTLLDLQDVVGVTGVFLLDGDGHVLGHVGKLLPTQTGVDAGIRQIFPVPVLLEQLKRGQTGVLETKLSNRMDIVVASDNVSPLGWHVVAVADPALLLKE